MTRGGCSSESHRHFAISLVDAASAKEPCSRDCGKVSPSLPASFESLENELTFFSDINSQQQPKLDGEGGRHSSVWEAETDSSEGSDILCDADPGTSEDIEEGLDEETEILTGDSCAEAPGAKWESFDLDSDYIISEDVLPTILEDETLQMPLLTARALARNSSWGISEAFQTSFEVLGSMAVDVGILAGSATQGVWEVAHAFLSCSVAFDSFVEMHLRNEEACQDSQEVEEADKEAE